VANLSGSYNNIAAYYKTLKQYDRALKYADTSYKLAVKFHSKNELMEVIQTYFEIYNDGEMGYIIEVEADELTKLYNLLEKNNNEEFEFLKSIENILSPYREMPFYFFTEYLNNNKINHYRFWFS
jgi:hypothetical protein